jgi:iron-sulfur cluster repair protein YtfE (RIC family)
MSDVLDDLKAQHREVEQLFEQIEQSDSSDRASLVAELAAALDMHMQLEERVVYPAMVRSGLDDEAEEATSEHDHARELLATIEEGLDDDPGVDGVVAAMKAAIEHHVEEEETEAFPQLRERLGADGMAQLTADAEEFLSSDAEVIDLDAATREELYEAARREGIEGRSSMNKEELREALDS